VISSHSSCVGPSTSSSASCSRADTGSRGKCDEAEVPSLVAGRAVIQVKVRVANLAVVGAIPVVFRLEVDDSHFTNPYP
jgi:hypothetical protein